MTEVIRFDWKDMLAYFLLVSVIIYCVVMLVVKERDPIKNCWRLIRKGRKNR